MAVFGHSKPLAIVHAGVRKVISSRRLLDGREGMIHCCDPYSEPCSRRSNDPALWPAR